MTDKKERISIVVGDVKYILPEGKGQEDAMLFEREVKDALRDGEEFLVPKEVDAVLNVGKTRTSDKERIMLMEAEMKAISEKMAAVNKKIAETETATTPPATEPEKK